MAINRQPVARRCKKYDISPSVLGYSKKETWRNSQNNRRRKASEYSLQLNEKQKMKFIYGILEKQSRRVYDEAERLPGVTGENMVMLLETRLDNVVYRLGLCKTRKQARQFVSHAHFLVNGKKVNIPSYRVKVGDVISVREKSKDIDVFKAVKEEGPSQLIPKWVELNQEELSGKVLALPTSEDLDFELQYNLIVEFYSK
ncbi:MAG: 30S ribosomal protein S4 [Eubacterium sp.]|jgi:small subunit ribosomal protein S4|nr:30S ribosomal protein S4 [Eubacterium sp.]MBQ8981091.1 30S ribosomal protein S4 [Eubacterium sp.]MBR2277878.1 30S ribosomal protein S4 [Eubacterium sp.]